MQYVTDLGQDNLGYVQYSSLAVIHGTHNTCIYLTIISCIFSIWGVINGLLFNVFIMLLAVSHFRATTSDPGEMLALNQNLRPLEEG